MHHVKWKTLRLPTAASLAALGLAGTWTSANSGDARWDGEHVVVPLTASLWGLMLWCTMSFNVEGSSYCNSVEALAQEFVRMV